MTSPREPRATDSAARPARALPLSASEVALTALTMAAATGLLRVFIDVSFLPRVLVAATGVHVLSAVLRRRGVPMGPSVLVLLGAGALVAIWTTVPRQTLAGIPTPDTLTAIRAALDDGLTIFGSEAAPVPAVPGLVLMAVAGTWVLGALADWAAFRVDARFESTVPSFTMFVFGATLGADRYRLFSSLVWVAALVLFLASHHSRSFTSAAPWLGHRGLVGQLALTRRATGLCVVTVVAAAFVGPNLPGAEADALVPWRGDGSSGDRPPRVTVSPLVDIRRRLVALPNVEAFTVAADVRSYWRLTALDSFDGRIWSGVASYSKAEGGLSHDIPSSLPTVPNRQEFQIGALQTIWLPAAFQPTRVVDGEGLRFDDVTASLVTEATVADGQGYVVESAVPRPDPGLLAAAPVEEPDGPYVELPADFSPRARSLAADVVAGSSTPYEAALALQQFFRGGTFRYSVEAPPGHDTNAIEHFLFDSRVGYCEQFAGSYAALARSVGLPARVAVGFTPGELGDDGLYHVRGEHAHAWPEVWIAGAGWVAFEPTPGRGAPGAEQYTGVPEQQATTGLPNQATTATTSPTAGGPTTTAPANTSVATIAPTSVPEAGGAGADDGSAVTWLQVLVATLAVVGAALLAAGLGAATNAVRRDRRRRGATRAADRVEVAWQEAMESLVRAGASPARGASPVRVADDATRTAGPAADQLRDLARLTTVVAYAAEEPGAEVAARAGRASESVSTTLRREQPPVRRLLWIIDPRRVPLP